MALPRGAMFVIVIFPSYIVYSLFLIILESCCFIIANHSHLASIYMYMKQHHRNYTNQKF